MDSQRRSASVITSGVAAPAATGCAGISGGPDLAGIGDDADTYTSYADAAIAPVDNALFPVMTLGRPRFVVASRFLLIVRTFRQGSNLAMRCMPDNQFTIKERFI